MTRLIDLDDSRHYFIGDDGEYEKWNIDPEVQALDVKTEKHGFWRVDDHKARCSNCYAMMSRRLFDQMNDNFLRYCPHCGALMDEGVMVIWATGDSVGSW